MSLSSPEHRKFPPDETEATTVDETSVPFYYPHNPHQKTLSEVATDSWPHDADEKGKPAPVHTGIIEATHPLLPYWHKVASSSIEQLEAEALAWTGLELVSRYQTELDMIPTVLLTVQDASNGALLDKVGALIHHISGEFDPYAIRI